jgi:DNA-binding MarR family transcriptional regulator
VKAVQYDLAARHGAVLATRDLGRAVGREVQDALGDCQRLLLNFAGVDVASPPFLDELVRAVRLLTHGGDSGRILVVVNYNEDVKESLALVLERQKLVMAALENDSIDLLGGTAQLRETLSAARELEVFTAPELADRLRMKLPAVHQRLKTLTDAGAVAREPDETAERGRRHTYRAAGPERSGKGAGRAKVVTAG